MKKNKKRGIWTDYWLMDDEEREALQEDCKEFLQEAYDDEEITEEMIDDEINFRQQTYFEDEFDYKFGQLTTSKFNNTKVRVFADLGLWYGHKNCYRDFNTVREAIMECLEDMNEIYEDRYGNLHIEAHHHDGCNHFVIKKFEDGKIRTLQYLMNVWGV